MDMLYVLVGMSALSAFLLRMELLIREESFKPLLWGGVVLFVAGVALHFTDAGRHSASGALLSTLPSLLLFRLMRHLFVRWFKREPRDATFNRETGLGPDRVFGLVYLLASASLTAGGALGARRLAEAGW